MVPIAGEGTAITGLMPRRPCVRQHSGVPDPCKPFGQLDAIRSFGQCQSLSVPMLSVGLRHVDPGPSKEERPEKPFSSLRNTVTLERQQEVGFSSLGLEHSVLAGLSPEKHANPERTRLKIRAHELVQSREGFEKKLADTYAEGVATLHDVLRRSAKVYKDRPAQVLVSSKSPWCARLW